MSQSVSYMYGLQFLRQMADQPPQEDTRKIMGYIILWDGDATDNAKSIGALDGTIGKSGFEACLFESRESAEEAIAQKIDSYRAYAEKYPNQEWPEPSEDGFAIITIRACE